MDQPDPKPTSTEEFSQITKPLSVQEQYKIFTVFYLLGFILLFAVTITAIVIGSIAIKSKVDSSNNVNQIIQLLVNSYYLAGNCWTCNAKTGDLTYISKYVENVPANSGASATPQFPTDRGNRAIIPNLVAFNNLAFVNGLDLTSPSVGQTTQLFFGNMSKIAVPSVSGLPTHSRSALIINAFNGDIVNENSRCVDFTYARIYIVYTFNNVLNITNFNLCLCPPNSGYPQHEFCHQFS